MVVKIKSSGDIDFGKKDNKKDIIKGRSKKMKCSVCPPNRGENAKRRGKHGSKKRRLKKQSRATIRKITVNEGSGGVKRLFRRSLKNPNDVGVFKRYLHKRKIGNDAFSAKSEEDKEKILNKKGNRFTLRQRDKSSGMQGEERQKPIPDDQTNHPRTHGKKIDSEVSTKKSKHINLSYDTVKTTAPSRKKRGRPPKPRPDDIKEGSGGINRLSTKLVHSLRSGDKTKADQYAKRINHKTKDGGYRAIDNLFTSAENKGPKKLKQKTFKFTSVKEGSMGLKRLERIQKAIAKKDSKDIKFRNKDIDTTIKRVYKDISGYGRAAGKMATDRYNTKSRFGKLNAIARGMKTKSLLKRVVPNSKLGGFSEGSMSKKRAIRRASGQLKKGKSKSAKKTLYKMQTKLKHDKTQRSIPFPYGLKSITKERTKAFVKMKRGPRISIAEAVRFKKKRKKKRLKLKKRKYINGGSGNYSASNINGGSGGGSC